MIPGFVSTAIATSATMKGVALGVALGVVLLRAAEQQSKARH